MSVDALTFGRLRGFNATEGLLLVVSIACSAVYLLTQTMQPFRGSVVLKALSIAPLAVLAFTLLREPDNQTSGFARAANLLRDRDNLILSAALSFSCLGDIFLDLDPATYFIHGLLAFLVAHFIYILLFVRNWPRPLRPIGKQLLLAAIVLIYSLSFSNWLSPGLGSFAKPVMLYVCVLTAMVITTILAGFSKPWVWLGAILFMISDSILATHKFKTDVTLRNYLVWVTYYLGQYGIAIGFLHEKLRIQK